MKRINEVFNVKLLVLCLFIALAAVTVNVEPANCQAEEINIINAKHLFDISADFFRPTDVTVASSGKIYVLDGINSRVCIFSSEGKPVSVFGSRGSGNGEFNKPLGICCSGEGKIYIADSGNHRVQVFDSRGNYLFAFAVKPGKSRKASDPTDVVIDDALGQCYVVDNDNNVVLVYNLSGTRLLEQWGTSGEKPGQFNFPFMAALDKHSDLYVVDVLNTRVQVLNKEGRTVSIIGKFGVDRAQFYRPKGITTDKLDRIFISDSYVGVVQVFKRYRKFLGVLGDASGNIIKLDTPMGLHIDNNNRLYIVEMMQNRVSVYKILD